MLDPEVVRRISIHLTLDDKAFLVGGQALNFWAEMFSDAPELRAYAPYTSKDIDYFGRVEAAEKLAKAIGGKVIRPQADHHTPQTAIVVATVAGQQIEIDFLNYVLGVSPESLQKQAVEIVVPVRSGDQQGSIRIPVMHPLHCLQSRAANVIKLGREGDVAKRQLAAAPIILREYVSSLLEEGDIREAQATLQALFKFLRSDPHGRQVHRHSQVDPLAVIASFTADERLDERFRQHNLTGMIDEIEDRRKSADDRLQQHTEPLSAPEAEREISPEDSTLAPAHAGRKDIGIGD